MKTLLIPTTRVLPDDDGRSRSLHRRSWTGRALFALLALLGLVDRALSEEAPRPEELKPLIERAWLEQPPIAEGLSRGQDTARLQKGTVESVVAEAIEIGRSRYGRFRQVGEVTDTYGPATNAWPDRSNIHDGPRITYWPVTVQLTTTYQQAKIQTDALGIDIKEKELVEHASYQCYAFKDKDERWKVTFEEPKDETPFYKIW